MIATIHPITPFDARSGTTIQFTWNGNQIYQVRCIIKDNETGTTVYDDKVSIMKQQYPFPGDSGLINGTYYVAYITVIDVNGNESSLQSKGTPFCCFSYPIFNLSINSNDIIRSSSYETTLSYHQEEDELLNNYQISLYSFQKTELQTSGTVFDTTSLSYIISDLENATQYYIRATGTTLHGIYLDTGYILFTVAYKQAQIFTPLELNNRPDIGAVEVRCNITSALGVPDTSDVIFIDNEYANLINNSVTYDTGFEVEGDFTNIIAVYSPIRNKSICTFIGDGFEANIYYHEGTYSDSNGEKALFRLLVNYGNTNYVLLSNYVEKINNSQLYAVLVNRVGAYFDIKAAVVDKNTNVQAINEGGGT